MLQCAEITLGNGKETLEIHNCSSESDLNWCFGFANTAGFPHPSPNQAGILSFTISPAFIERLEFFGFILP